MNRIHFLSGLPRSGSTLLGSILNQNPAIHATCTSPVYSLLVNANQHFNLIETQYTFDIESVSDSVYRSIVKAFYPDERERPVVFDKNRGWPKHVDAIRYFVDSRPKIICPVRPIAEIIASYIALADNDADNFIDRALREAGKPIDNEARADILWSSYLKSSYEAMAIGLEKDRDSLLLVSYDSLTSRPSETLAKIYEFCELKKFSHDFDHIHPSCAESKDEAWGMKNLHVIRPSLRKVSRKPTDVLPQAAVDYFAQFDLRGAA